LAIERAVVGVFSYDVGVGRQIGGGQRNTPPLSNVVEGYQNKQRIPALSNQHGSLRHRRCYCATPIHRLDQQRELRWRQCPRAVDDRRPDEFVMLKTLGEQAQPVAIPSQQLDQITILHVIQHTDRNARSFNFPSDNARARANVIDHLIRASGDPQMW
jgi:hypothetical protein